MTFPATGTSVTLSVLSTEYLRVPVYAKVAGKFVSLANATVHMAIIGPAPTASPVTGDWFLGAWDYDSTLETYFAQSLIGPSGHSVTVGTHSVWLKVTLSPEAVVRRVGTLVVVE